MSTSYDFYKFNDEEPDDKWEPHDKLDQTNEETVW